MKKSILLLSLFWLPFLAIGQWSVNLNAGGGMAIESIRQTVQLPSAHSEQFYSSSGALGYSFVVGMKTVHYFTPAMGLSAGVEYYYANSSQDDHFTGAYPNNKWHQESLNLPVSLLWSPGHGHHSVIPLGFSANFNLLKWPAEPVSLQTYTYNPVFWSVHIGYYYRLGSRFQLGIMLNRDISRYLKIVEKNVYIQDVAPRADLISRLYFYTTRLSVSYRLFGHNRKR